MRPYLYSRSVAFPLLMAGVLLAGCADNSWQAVRARDTVGDYNKYLRASPDSEHAERALQRIEFLRVRSRKTIPAFEEFVATYPDSPWIEELHAEMEPLYFERARRDNRPEAYRAFLSTYPDGAMAERARGNLGYVEQVRPEIAPAALRAFLDTHPDSDFAEEAEQSLALIDLHRDTQIQRLGVRVEVAPNVAQPQRVRKGFAAMVARKYLEMGIQVEPIQRGGVASDDMDGWVRIDYEESQASGVFGGSTLVARCRVRIYHRRDAEQPVWDRVFEAPAEHILQGQHGRDKTIFGSSRYTFWNHFFVPVSTWATAEARLAALKYFDEVTDIDVEGDRAALLFARGGFDYIDASKPGSLETLQRYRREHDLSRWRGIRIASDQLIVMWGPDGAEIVDLSQHHPRPIGRWEVPDIGAVRSTQVFDQTALIASSKGVYAIRLQQRPLKAHRLFEGDFVGLELRKPYIYLVRPDRIEVTSPKHLLRHLTGSRVGLGKSFGATRARMLGGALYVFSKDETIRFSLDQPGKPFIEKRFELDALGRIHDLAVDEAFMYVLGDRGLQVATLEGDWVADSIQISADHSMVKKGQYLFLVGERILEIVDIAPYAVAPAAMAP